MNSNRRSETGTEPVLVATVSPPHNTADDETPTGIDPSNTGDGPATVTFDEIEELHRTFTPTTLELVETIRRERPASINETARFADRAVKNVHDELKRLDRAGVIDFVEDGQAKRPIVRFDELLIDISLVNDTDDHLARRRSERRIEGVCGRISDALFALDTDARVTYLNEEAEELLGRSSDRLMGAVLWERSPVMVETSFEDQCSHARQTQERVAFEEYVPCRDRWVAARIYPSETGLSIHVRDITERKRRERQLDKQRDRLAAINDLNRAVRDITHAAIDTASRAEIEQQACDLLIETGIYRVAWIGDVDRGSQQVTATCKAGDTMYLDEIEISTSSDDPHGQGPTGKAVRTHDPQFVQDISEAEDYEPWRATAQKRGFHSSAAIPIQYNGVLYGVLNVYAPRPNAFTTIEREIMVHLGEVIGHAIHAIEQRKVLTGDTVLELEFRSEDIASRFADRLDLDEDWSAFSLTTEPILTDDDSIHLLITVSGTSPERAKEALRRFPVVDRVTSLTRDEGDGLLFEAEISDPSISTTVASYGGRMRRLEVLAGELRLFAELPPDVDTRDLIASLRQVYPDIELLSQRAKPRDNVPLQRLHGALAERLTEKQRETLTAAYFAGYFDWPRMTTGEEVAEMLGVSPPTVSHHLRAAQRKLMTTLYGDRNVRDSG